MYPPDNPTRPCRPKAGQGLVTMMMMMDDDDDNKDVTRRGTMDSIGFHLQRFIRGTHFLGRSPALPMLLLLEYCRVAPELPCSIGRVAQEPSATLLNLLLQSS